MFESPFYKEKTRTLRFGFFSLVETGGVVCIFASQKLLCSLRQAVGKQQSTGLLQLMFESPFYKEKTRTLRFGFFLWWRLGDSNPRPHACEASRGDAPCRGRSNQPKNRCKHLTFGWSAFADRLFSFYLDRMPIADGILSHWLFTKQDTDLILYTSSHNFLHPRASQNNRE